MNDSIQLDNLTCKSAPFAPLPHSTNTLITFNDLNREILRFTSEGRLEKGPGLSDDAASLLFFDACQKVFGNMADELRDLRAAVAEEILVNAELGDKLLTEQATFAEFKTHTREQQSALRAEVEKLSAELARQKVESNHNWQFQEISEQALKRAEAAEMKLTVVRAAVIEACKNALVRPLIWYPEKTQAYIHPNSVLEINEFQTKACVAAVQAVFDVATLQNSESKGEK